MPEICRTCEHYSQKPLEADTENNQLESYDLRTAWNIELAFVRVAESTALGEIVPDVFGPTEVQVGFEDATSAQRDSDLCATRLGAWAILIDVTCRLSSLESFLHEISLPGELFVFRISGFPVSMRWNQGKNSESLEGNQAFLSALEPEILQPEESNDGELLAWALMRQRTAVSLNDLWEAKFSVFALT